jgi:DNA topoisomerase-3
MGTIFGQHARFKITSVTGHIFCRDFPPKYADWYQCDPIELFDALTLKREVPPAYQASPDNNLVSHLKKEAEGCSYLVLWLDNDKEGENICFEVVDITSAHLLKLNGQQIFRAKFSSIARRDIIHAFESLAEGPNKNESSA